MKFLPFKLCILICLLTQFAYSQSTISGTFTMLANQQIRLEGFNGFNTYVIDRTQTDNKGNFTLQYAPNDYGMGCLISEDEKPFIIIISGKNIQVKGKMPAMTESIQILKGKENLQFGRYASEQPRREQALSAWAYLENIYSADSLFAMHKTPINAIEQEVQRIHNEDKAFLASLDPESYVSWFLPVRKMVSSVSAVAQYRTEEIPTTIEAFRKMDYTDTKMYKSGLLRNAIESHFWLIENSGRTLDSAYIEMNISIDRMVENLLADEQKLNEITNHLFKFLESRSLFEASEHLALKLLNETACTLNNDLAAQLESYRAMKVGNTAPEFAFGNIFLAPAYKEVKPKKLSDINSKYTLIIFGASWCPKCNEELSKMVELYPDWKNQGVEVVFISLDEEQKAFENFAKPFPFISMCDYQKWDSPVVKDYFVFATPTMYLLDKKQEILLRPNSVAQMDSWVDWYLVQGNK
ncbi:MAG: TlpA disulfide reductase family protein [Prolixibacteraceae bacterium]|jgi:thiol-disulfide isomerase/thioredoxin|nr:TlpA disulfide reductase family protein [Prolixibacteraceae bacterium]